MSQLSMWQKFHRENVAEQKNKVDTENKIPDWLQRYVEYKFNLYDRTGEIVFNVVFNLKQIMIFEHMVGHLCLCSFSRTCDAWCVQATASSTRRSSNMCCPTSVCPPRMPGPATCCFQMWVTTQCTLLHYTYCQ